MLGVKMNAALHFTCSGSSLKNKQMFNIICELPETVARTLVPRMRVVKGTGKSINYLTPPRILLALVSAWVRRGRWFDDKVILNSVSFSSSSLSYFSSEIANCVSWALFLSP